MRASERHGERLRSSRLALLRAALSLAVILAGGLSALADESGGYQIDPDGAGPAAAFSIENPDFNEKSFRLQTVFRWEWRPGSTLYAVWTQQRENETGAGRFDFWRDARRLFGTDADNVFAVKVSYWLGR